MTNIEKIFKALEKFKGEFKLCQVLDKRNEIRHKCMQAINYAEACPLNVLCNGEFYNSDSSAFAKKLNITKEDAEAIMYAADFDDSTYRNKLLEVLGL